VRFDRSARSVVVVCQATGCGAREVTASSAAADRWAALHLETAHPRPSTERTRVLGTLSERARRADGSGNP